MATERPLAPTVEGKTADDVYRIREGLIPQLKAQYPLILIGFAGAVGANSSNDSRIGSKLGGGSLPAFSTDSYFSRTLKPGHHNFFEIVLLEPALDPALSEATRHALAAANIRHVYTYKDIAIGLSADTIRYFGFDNTIRFP
jgi:hypothetical protein